MAIRGKSIVVEYMAWDGENNVGKTDDVNNQTIMFIRDGVATEPENMPQEVDSASCPGVYSILITAAEANCNTLTISGSSSSDGITILPVVLIMEGSEVDYTNNGLKIKHRPDTHGNATVRILTIIKEYIEDAEPSQETFYFYKNNQEGEEITELYPIEWDDNIGRVEIPLRGFDGAPVICIEPDADENYFSSWEGDGILDNTTFTVTLTEDKTVIIFFTSESEPA
jgi:hypothetical protein